MFELMKKYTKQYKIPAILCPIFMVLEVMTDISVPFIMKQIVDFGIPNKDASYVIQMGILMFIMALLGMSFGVTSTFFGAKAGYGMGANVRDDMYKKIQTFSFNQLDEFSVASLITRVTNDTTTVSQVGMMSLRMAIRFPFMLISATIAAFSIDVKLASIFALFIPLLGILVFLIMRNAKTFFKAMQERIDDLNSVVNEDLTNIRVIKSFVREDYEKSRFAIKNDNLRNTSMQAFNLLVIMIPAIFAILYSGLITILWFGGIDVIEGRLQLGEITALVQYCTMIYSSLLMVSNYIMQLTRANTSAKRIFEVLNTQANLTNPTDGGIEEIEDGSIEFENVNFKYAKNSENSLNNINLKIKSGETIGIIGSTGSSKSTLVQLIPRLYDVSSGVVKVGGVDVREYNLDKLRDEVAFVLQENTLFKGTIRSNMLWGHASAKDEEIIEALKNAQAWEFVSKLPNKLDTEVAQGGSNFSGGQRQRLCIARALIKNPKIIILDDSTSAVDMTTDAKLRRAFDINLSGTTVLNIAQRISSIQDANRIIVMNHGSIDAIGTNDELLESNKIYRELYETQIKGGLAQ